MTRHFGLPQRRIGGEAAAPRGVPADAAPAPERAFVLSPDLARALAAFAAVHGDAPRDVIADAIRAWIEPDDIAIDDDEPCIAVDCMAAGDLP